MNEKDLQKERTSQNEWENGRENYDNKKVEIAGFIVPLELDDAIDEDTPSWLEISLIQKEEEVLNRPSK